ncbi:cdc42-interacting protein 4-like isoform X3 [Eriocheir sinensis]|uniref:cdc42-interacting protein 4-like isoform X3 n=1 Tax=Eriocheir sinensis TaxID=95602 RepID=UPI0021C8B0EE|nr:cdc42-interacting protein 4-like isoform X3 [Eriocheir sinensis]
MVYRCDEVLLSYNKFNETKDQWDSIAGHTQKGITFLEQYGHFVKERCQIELDYARGLRRLVKTYLPKKKEGEDQQFTSVKAFRDAVNETADLAGQHEVISENLTTVVLADIAALVKEMKEDRKKHLADGGRVQQQLNHSLQQLEKAKKNYEKAFREAEKAQDNYLKADADLHLSRAEVEKQRMNASIKSQQCEDSKNEYANQLQKTNQLQGDHYNTVMPGIFQGLQDLDEKRINNFKNLLKQSVEIERAVFPIINKCLDGIVTAADSIDEKMDSQVVIERYKSGFTPPGDIPFDDLSTPRQNGDSTPTSHPPLRQDTIKGTISASKGRKRGGIFGIFASNKEDFSDLPPNQRKKRIQQRIDDVTNKLHQETAARDGLLKMKEVYEGNPSLGDPMSIIGQLNDSCQKIEKLRGELQRYQNMLEEVDGEGQGSGGAASGGPSTPNASLARHHVVSSHHNGGASPRSSVTSHRTSLSDESLSRSASDSSVCTNPPSSSNTTTTTTTTTSTTTTATNSLHRVAISGLATTTSTTTTSSTTTNSCGEGGRPAPPDPLPSQGSSHSPESGIGLSHNSLPGSDTYDQPDAGEDENAEFYDTEPLPIIGTCRALYVFDGTSEGSMSMTEGEELNVIELDQGDGWTRVRRVAEFQEGFVPTSYIEMSLYNNC